MSCRKNLIIVWQLLLNSVNFIKFEMKQSVLILACFDVNRQRQYHIMVKLSNSLDYIRLHSGEQDG